MTASPSPAVRIVPLTALDRRYRSLRLPGKPASRSALAASLEHHGQQQPVLVSDGIEADRLVLVDGHKRAELLEAAGVEEVLVRVLTLDAVCALAVLVTANAAQCGMSDLEEAWVLEVLHREHGLTQVEIAERVGRHKTWVCRRLKLVTHLERCVQDDVRLGLVSVSVARELVRLPRGNQAAASQAAVRHSLSRRQVGRLVDVLRSVDPSQRLEVLRDPLAHLPAPSARSEPKADARLSEAANRIRQQLLRIHGATNRLDELFLDHPPASFTERDVALLAKLASPVLSCATGAFERVQSLILVAGEQTRAP